MKRRRDLEILTRTILTVTTVLVAGVWPQASAAAPQLRFQKSLSFAFVPAETLVVTPLDSDVYAATAPHFSDLRLRDAADNEVPFILRQATTQRQRTVRRTFPVERPTVQLLENGGLEITFEIDRNKHPEPPQGFTLVTPLKNFEHRVSILRLADKDQAGKDGTPVWVPLAENLLVFDFTKFMDVQNTDLPLPASGPHIAGGRYRIVIDSATQQQESQIVEFSRTLRGAQQIDRTEHTVANRQPFRIDRIDFWHDAKVTDAVVPNLIPYPLTHFSIPPIGFEKTTRVFVDSRWEPLQELVVVTLDRNFSRTARVETRPETSGKSRRQQSLASATLTKIDFGGLNREQLTIPMPESRASGYQIVIDNLDSPPLAISGVIARGAVYELVFLARPGEAYRLAYGGKADPAEHDTAAIFAAVSQHLLPLTATLGDEQERAGQVGQPGLIELLNDWRFLLAIIGFFVGLLAVGLYRAIRQLESTPL